MLSLHSIHHIAIICTDYQASKEFYTSVLGLEVQQEVYREHRDSWKCDLTLNGHYVLELFSFPNPPARPSRPEAAGMRHLAFEVLNVEEEVAKLREKGIEVEDIRVDEYTGKRFTFFADPDDLPIELYER